MLLVLKPVLVQSCKSALLDMYKMNICYKMLMCRGTGM